MHKIKAVIFDLDGTLADTLPLCIQAFRRSVEPLINRSVSDDEIIATFGPSEEGTIMALAPGNYDKGIADYLRFYKSMHTICPAPFEGIPGLLDTLKNKGVRLAMVTGKGKHSTAISLERFALAGFFDMMETGSPFGPRKAEGIGLIAGKMQGISKEEIIYVGDAPGDIVASRKAGIPVVAAAWAATTMPEQLIALQPDEIFYTVQEFGTWLSNKTG